MMILSPAFSAGETGNGGGTRVTIRLVPETEAPSPEADPAERISPGPGSALTPKPTETPKPTATPKPTETPKPTATAAPTVTPRPVITVHPAVIRPAGETPAPSAETTGTPESAAGAKPVSTAGPAATPTPDAESEPAATPAPTATPTATPEPTATPTPTPEPTPVQPPVTPPPAPLAFPTVIDEVNDSETWSDFRFPKDRPLLEIWIANIRDADATLILYEGQAWMIDCADYKMALRTAAMLRQLGITHIEKVFNTHPHHDHILGLGHILEAARVDELLLCFPEDSTEHMEKVLPVCEEQKITVSHYGHGDEYTMGDGNVKLTFWQNEGSDLSINNRSACTKIVYGERSMLLLADLEYRGEQELEALVGAEALKCDLFKYPHHGKKALKESFFQAMDASLAVVTNHQKIEQASSYLGYKHFPTIYTNVKGVYTHLATDGRRWLCEYVPIR